MATLPLEGKNIVITRAEKKSLEFAQQIKKLGGTPIIIPLLSFEPTRLTKSEMLQFSRLYDYEWLIFTSSNGVDYFFHHADQLKINFQECKVKIAVIGDKTKLALEEKGFEPSILPNDFVAEGLFEALQKEKMNGMKVLYIQGDLARDFIPTKLSEIGAKVTKLSVYKTVCPSNTKAWVELLQQNIDAITFTSPSTIKHFTHLLEGQEWKQWISKTVVCCIGPITEKAALSFGIKSNVVPRTYTMEHLLHELILYFKKMEGLK